MDTWLVGADEAGRGSLVGEMIVAVAAVRSDCVETLQALGVRDSKDLSPSTRASIYKEFSRLDCLAFSVYPVKPSDIDRYSLTKLTEEAIYKAFKLLLGRVDPASISRVTVDRYGRVVKLKILLRKLGYRGPIVVEERADSKYIEVSAASIVAKHVRDARIRVLSSLYGVRGSGYPSDPRTIDWVMDVVGRGEKPPIIRYSWGTLEGTGFRVRKKRGGEHRITLDDFL
ncbi:MAG: ribonuclease HII [Desulfurococcales archaeon]|nr:ribonuclease HII [Desulfurococcales archaeon]